MSNYLINATGLDFIELWYYTDNKIFKERKRNDSWVFVSGSEYDLDFIENQLENSDYKDYYREERKDIYGSFNGIRIITKPSKIKDLVYAIDCMGIGRKFSIFNADINPQLRYISENNLVFFPLESLDDYDPDIPSTRIGGRMHGNVITDIEINGREMKPSHDVYEYLKEELSRSVFVIYNNNNHFFKRLISAMKDSGIDVPVSHISSGGTYTSYGQVHHNNGRVNLKGKICIEENSFIYGEAGIPGLMEISRMSSLPPSVVSYVTPGTAVSSLEISYAIKNNVLVPLYKSDYESEKTISGLAKMDMGGTVLQPVPGIYTDVTEIDFSSMYPSIIVNYNLSPETIARNTVIGEGSDYYSIREGRGFLSRALEELLRTRLFYKSIKGSDPVYSKRDTALKWMLLTSFGYTGYKNAKFGKIEVHESITSIGRKCLSDAMKISESNGFSVIHGIVDSLWISGKGSTGRLLDAIKEKTKIDIVVDGQYEWIAFLPSRSEIGAVNRYIGLRKDGSFKVRGIEIRQKNLPGIAKKFQMDALAVLKECKSIPDIAVKYDAIKDLEHRYVRSIAQFDRDDFRIRVSPSKWKDQYSVRNMTKRAMEKFSHEIEIMPGQEFYISVIDNRRSLFDIDDSQVGIDREFYRKILKRSFESFDFIISWARKSIGISEKPFNKTLDLF
ncbi:MAG: type B DNA-directed DNA polymerase [Thermoplasmataceae archaeon]|jgi:DNA polymerase I